jgi:hypothetical protein
MRGKPHPDLDAACCEQFSPWTKCLRLLRNPIFSIESGGPRLNGSSGMYIYGSSGMYIYGSSASIRDFAVTRPISQIKTI